MRTTVAIDDEVLARAKALARQRDLTLGELVQASLVAYLASPPRGGATPLPVFTRGTGMRPGIDPTSNASMFEAADGDMREHVDR